ncbi:MAG: hypothetical protein CL912_01365 [Deltaproteobacteria bacterium]|nr:hypothetical protein [Deltaproteobacteria bacterium]
MALWDNRAKAKGHVRHFASVIGMIRRKRSEGAELSSEARQTSWINSSLLYSYAASDNRRENPIKLTRDGRASG